MGKLSFGFAKPEHSPGFLLWQTTMLWQRLIKSALEPHQISHAQFVIMAVGLWFEETKQLPTQVAIVNKTKLDKMTVSKSLKKLVKEGLVKRDEHSDDSRAKSVALTAAGKRLIKKLIPIVEKVDAQFFSTISPANQKGLLKNLNKIIDSHDKKIK